MWYISKCPTLVGDVDGGGGYARVEVRVRGKNSVFSAQFFCEPKASLKKKIFKILVRPILLCYHYLYYENDKTVLRKFYLQEARMIQNQKNQSV